LDTLPEEKSTNTQYKRVYSDWRPTIEKTDIVGAMEAIEGGFFCGSISGGETSQTPQLLLWIGSMYIVIIMRMN
jgi:hypothetical protein